MYPRLRVILLPPHPAGKDSHPSLPPPTPTQPSSRLTPATKQEARAGQRILFYVNNYTEDVGASEGSRGACTLAWPRRELTGARQPGRSGPRDSTAARPAPWGRAHASDPDPGRGLSLPFPEQENGGKSAAQPLGRGAPVPFKDALRCDQTFTRTLFAVILTMRASGFALTCSVCAHSVFRGWNIGNLPSHKEKKKITPLDQPGDLFESSWSISPTPPLHSHLLPLPSPGGLVNTPVSLRR